MRWMRSRPRLPHTHARTVLSRLRFVCTTLCCLDDSSSLHESKLYHAFNSSSSNDRGRVERRRRCEASSGKAIVPLRRHATTAEPVTMSLSTRKAPHLLFIANTTSLSVFVCQSWQALRFACLSERIAGPCPTLSPPSYTRLTSLTMTALNDGRLCPAVRQTSAWPSSRTSA